MMRIAKRIVKAYRNYGFASFIIIGQQGVGKTTYALKNMRDVYAQILGIDRNKAWELALKYTFFDIADVGSYILTAIESRKRIPAILFDDAGNWISKYAWRTEELQALFQLYNMARTVVAGIIFTTPAPNDIALYIREKSFYYVKITRSLPPNAVIGDKKTTEKILREYDAFAWFKVMHLGTGLRGEYVQKYSLAEVEPFTLKLPDWVRRKYDDARYIALGEIGKNYVAKIAKGKRKNVDLGF